MSTTTALIGPRVKPRTLAQAVRPAALPAVVHLDGGHDWGGGQNQVRLLMHELAELGMRQMCLCPEGSPLHQRLIEERLPVRGITRRVAVNPLGIIDLSRRIRGYNVLHAHDAHALQMALLPAATLGIPVVASRRTSFRTSALKWNRAARVIAVSANVRDVLLQAGVKPWKIRLIHSGINVREVQSLPPSRPPLRALASIPADAFVAGTIGALIGCKNHVSIVEAAAHTDGIRWAIIGDGPMRPAIEQRIRERGAEDRIFLAGRIEDARRMLQEIDVFVFASVGEALGTSVLDAMAAGIPVIAADSAGPAEVLGPVHARTSATLFPPNDPDALARLVERVRAEPVLRERMMAAQNSRIEDFRSERTAMKTLDVYREVLR
ncbi:MAG TPA: glycosyltransferase [Longimicrobiales bacterium]